MQYHWQHHSTRMWGTSYVGCQLVGHGIRVGQELTQTDIQSQIYHHTQSHYHTHSQYQNQISSRRVGAHSTPITVGTCV